MKQELKDALQKWPVELQSQSSHDTETLCESVFRIILAQNSNPSLAEKAVQHFKTRGLMNETSLQNFSIDELERELQVIAPFKRQALKIYKLFKTLQKQDFKLEDLCVLSTTRLREWLQAISGLGIETCDTLMLYVFARPVFAVDTGIHRIMRRHRLIAEDADYFTLQDDCLKHFESDVSEMQIHQHKMNAVGSQFCKKTNPDCSACPLRDVNGGPWLDS